MKQKILKEIPELTRLSSKGQIVIPKDIRVKMKIKEGSVFAVVSTKKGMLVMKKIEDPILKEDLLLLNEVEDAWKEIEEGKYIKTNKKEFLEEMKEW
jgi:AbrB family looped-hinge helix DNA binding protein